MVNDDLLTDVKREPKSVVGKLKERHSQLRYLKASTLVLKFDGLDAALDYIPKYMEEPRRAGESSKHKDGGDFYQFDTFEEAVDVFRNKPESVAHFDEGELVIKDAKESGLDPEYDVQGDYIDMGRYMEGVPESFGTLYNGTARNRRITVNVNLTQVNYIQEKDIRHRAERILRLVDALEVGGARCELIASESSDNAHIEILLKSHDESLIINDLAVVSQPDFLRRIIFRYSEYSDTWSYGYGGAMDYGRAVTAEMLATDNVNEIVVFIDGSISGKGNIDKLFDQVERLLVWELSKPVPEVNAIKVEASGVYFNDNGSRDAAEIQREGKEVIKNE